jgi:hypothetical protein
MCALFFHTLADATAALTIGLKRRRCNTIFLVNLNQAGDEEQQQQET